MIDNPYAPPQAALTDHEPQVSEAEAVRRAHIGHEVQLKSVGSLYFLYTIGLAMTIATTFAAGRGLEIYKVFTAAALCALCAASAALGYGFRRLRSWVRIPGAIVSGLGLLAIPVGTIINGYVLYLILNARGRVVLAPDYARIVAATPHVKYRRTVGDWIAIGLLVLIVGSIAAVLVLAPMSR